MKNSNVILFKEIQQMKTAWVWLVLFGLSTIFFTFLILTYDNSNENKFTINGLLIIGSILGFMFIGLYLLFKVIRLEVVIKSDSIEYKYIPIIVKTKIIKRDDILDYEIKEYNPAKEATEYRKKHGRKTIRREYYYMSRETCLFLTLNSGKIVMFGTKREQALRKAINTLMQED